MKISISNIAWAEEYDLEMFSLLKEYGFSGLEIAPTRIFKNEPYNRLEEAGVFAAELNYGYGLEISSMQSIWFGKTEKLFGNEEERKELLAYTKKAIDFASVVNCKNLVFGSPKNRVINNPEDIKIAIDFFRECGNYAMEKGTTLAIEPNPVLYGTNFINTTTEAIEIVNSINCEGIKVNLDLGTIIYNEESLQAIKDNIDKINHIHISEPNLALIEKRLLHKELAKVLKASSYKGYVSIEMGKRDNIEEVKATMKYIYEVFA